jgi:hypothetical protein
LSLNGTGINSTVHLRLRLLGLIIRLKGAVPSRAYLSIRLRTFAPSVIVISKDLRHESYADLAMSNALWSSK